jgi:hypothetical protein
MPPWAMIKRASLENWMTRGKARVEVCRLCDAETRVKLRAKVSGRSASAAALELAPPR